MPIYEYRAREPESSGCEHCRAGFEIFQSLSAPRVERCPQCGAPVVRVPSVLSIGASKSGLDDRAKAAGFHKLKRLGRGEYERQY